MTPPRDGDRLDEHDAGAAESDSEQPLRDALEFAAVGVRVFPANEHGVPLVAAWKHAASASTHLIRKWWARWPHARVAIVIGRRSRIAVLRVQGDLGARALAKLEREHGALPATPELACDLPPCDRLLFFRHEARSAAKRMIAAGISVYGDGAYLVMPPIARPEQVSA